MGKGEHGRGEQARPRQRQDDADKCLQGRGPECLRHLQRALAGRLERIAQGLHSKRQRVHHRADQEPGKRERQQPPAQALRQPPQRPIRPHQHQQVETTNPYILHAFETPQTDSTRMLTVPAQQLGLYR